MAILKIKYPTLITSLLDSHYEQCIQMRSRIINLIDNYNNLSPNDKLRIPYRGKSKSKVLKTIHYDVCNIGDKQSIIICVEEYKEGYDDLYLQKRGNANIDAINANDRLGSSRNYALLYPIIENRNDNWENKWLVVVYDTPNKDDNDIINTIKYTVNKVFGFPFKFVVPTAFEGIRNIPSIEVSFVMIENVDNEHIALHNYVVSQTAKTTKTIKYEDVPVEDLHNIINDRSDFEPGKKRKIKMFFDRDNKNNYKTISQEMDENGNVSSTLLAKYSSTQEITIDEMNHMTDAQIMVRNFTAVITNYLTNGHV